MQPVERVMRRLVVVLLAGLLLAAPTAANAAGRSWRAAATLTQHGSTTRLVCGGHRFNDHYWRVGFCTGRYSQYPQVVTFAGHPSWSAWADARQGALARIALSEGTPPVLRGWDRKCGVFGDC